MPEQNNITNSLAHTKWNCKYKGKSSLMIYQKWGNMKFAYRNREFWSKGYYVDTVGKNTTAIKEYIANQLKQDKEADQLSVFDPNDPFKGSK